MRSTLTVGDTELAGVLTGGAAALDFASLLPLTVSLSDFHATERIAQLPRRLTTYGEPTSTRAVPGDIAFYAPWGNLALFYKDQSPAAGLVLLGHLDEPATDLLAGLPEAADAVIAVAADSKR
jgi:hypothetical protein